MTVFFACETVMCFRQHEVQKHWNGVGEYSQRALHELRRLLVALVVVAVAADVYSCSHLRCSNEQEVDQQQRLIQDYRCPQRDGQLMGEDVVWVHLAEEPFSELSRQRSLQPLKIHETKAHVVDQDQEDDAEQTHPRTQKLQQTHPHPGHAPSARPRRTQHGQALPSEHSPLHLKDRGRCLLLSMPHLSQQQPQDQQCEERSFGEVVPCLKKMVEGLEMRQPQIEPNRKQSPHQTLYPMEGLREASCQREGVVIVADVEAQSQDQALERKQQWQLRPS